MTASVTPMPAGRWDRGVPHADPPQQQGGSCLWTEGPSRAGNPRSRPRRAISRRCVSGWRSQAQTLKQPRPCWRSAAAPLTGPDVRHPLGPWGQSHCPPPGLARRAVRMLNLEAAVSLAPDPSGDSPGAVLLTRDLSGAVPVCGPGGSPADLSFAAGFLCCGPEAILPAVTAALQGTRWEPLHAHARHAPAVCRPA